MRTFTAIEYGFVLSIIATFSVVGVGGMLFGFQLSDWAEWQGILVGVAATVVAVAAAALGVRMASGDRPRI
jgi:hypothetical protein